MQLPRASQATPTAHPASLPTLAWPCSVTGLAYSPVDLPESRRPGSVDTFTQPPLVISWAKRYIDQKLILLLEDRTRENPYSDPARRLREF